MLQRVHRGRLARYSELAALGGKRKVCVTAEVDVGVPPAKQLKMQQCAKTAACVSQATVGHLVLDFIVEGLLPFSTVELPAFKRLVTGLQPGKSVPCRATVKTRMQSRVVELQALLCATLQSVECVATVIHRGDGSLDRPGDYGS